jgi:hypothetical protein
LGWVTLSSPTPVKNYLGGMMWIRLGRAGKGSPSTPYKTRPGIKGKLPSYHIHPSNNICTLLSFDKSLTTLIKLKLKRIPYLGIMNTKCMQLII